MTTVTTIAKRLFFAAGLYLIIGTLASSHLVEFAKDCGIEPTAAGRLTMTLVWPGIIPAVLAEPKWPPSC